MSQKQKTMIACGFIGLIILIDQLVKIYVKTHFFLGESVEVFSWFHIRFVENNGMAFGIEVFNKIFLTLFRIVAVGFIGYYLHLIIKKNYSIGYILCVSALLAGAFGNIIDCVFYGVIFDDSQFPHLATLFPEKGYAPLFYGKVVDMLYFPLIDTTFPSWLPLIGGHHFSFFDPVFNIADSAICVSIFCAILFERNYIKEDFKEKDETEKTDNTPKTEE